MKCPKCSSELVFIDNGPRLQYHYCRTCKDELDNLKPKVVTPKTTASLEGDLLTQEEIDEIFAGLP